MQQQQSKDRLSPFGLFRTHPFEETPRIFAWYDEMRTSHPVIRDDRWPVPMWQVFRYADVMTVLNDHSRFSSRAYALSGDTFLDTLVILDPPDHRKLRNLVNLAFTPRASARYADLIASIAQGLLDQVRERGSMDVVADLGFPLSAKLVAALLGVPPEDWNLFQRWARIGAVEPAQEQQGNGRTMRQEMVDYFSHLLDERLREPREDMISALSVAEVDGERLSRSEILSFCTLLLAAGQETTKNLLANFIICMTDHLDSLAHLKRDPGLLPGAIEEVMRYLPPSWSLFRLTRCEVELSGQRIPANQMVLVWLASANRDPARFPDPDRFDIEREGNHHMAFGHGVHFCVGAPLARLEARIALSLVLAQLKQLQRVEDAPVLVSSGIAFGIRSLPITFQPY